MSVQGGEVIIPIRTDDSGLDKGINNLNNKLKDTSKNVENSTNAFKKMGDGLLKKFFGVEAMIRVAEGAIRQLGQAFDFVVKAAGKYSESFQKANKDIQRTFKGIEMSIGQVAGKAMAPLLESFNKFLRSKDGIGILSKGIAVVIVGFKAMAGAISGTFEILNSFITAAQIAGEAMSALFDPKKTLAQKAAALQALTLLPSALSGNVLLATKSINDSMKDMGKEVDTLSKEMAISLEKNMNDPLKIKSTGKTGRNVTMVGALLGTNPEIEEELLEKIKYMGEVAAGSSSIMADAFSGIGDIMGDGFGSAIAKANTTINTSIGNLIKNIKGKAQEVAGAAVQIGASAISAVGSIVSGVFAEMNKQFTNDQAQLTANYNESQRIAEENSKIAAERAANDGLTNEEFLDKKISDLSEAIKTETGYNKKKQLQDELDKAKADKKALQAEKDKNKKIAEAKFIYEMAMWKSSIDSIKAQQAQQTAMVWINAAAGIVGAWGQGIATLGPIAGSIVAGIATAALLAVAGAQTGLIWSQSMPSPPSPPAFASGTNSAPAGMALVGERGRELVQMSGGERVFNNADTEMMMNPNFNVFVRVGERELRDIMVSIQREEFARV